MKLFRISLLLFCVALLPFCVAEADRDCQTRFTLMFEYKTSGNGDNRDLVTLFNENINVVDVFIYDTNGNLVQEHRGIPRTQLGSFTGSDGVRRPGMVLSLYQGTYRVVAWGNADPERKTFHNTTHVDNARIAKDNPAGGAPLHYGPGTLKGDNAIEFIIDVPAFDDNTGYSIMPLSRAHIELQVFVVGAEFVPDVQVTSVAAGIDFDKATFGEVTFGNTATTIKGTPEQNSQEARFVSFYTPLFSYDTNKSVVVRNEGNVIPNGAINLSDALNANNVVLANTYVPRMIVPIIITVGENVVINVTIPGWIIEPTEPEL